jgi:hypothetical protein
LKSLAKIRKRKSYHLAEMPKLSGEAYLAWGASLMGIKFGIDSFVSSFFFHRQWLVWNYFAPGAFSGVTAFTNADMWFYAGMLMVALPFAFWGSFLTLRRLNTIGLPPWMVILFYTPFVNMIFFIIIAVVKSAPTISPIELDPFEITREQSNPENKTKQIGTTIGALPNANDLQPPANNPQPPAIVEHHEQQKDVHFGKEPVAISRMSTFPGEVTALKIISKMPVDSPRAFLIAALLPVPISVMAAMFSVTVLGVYGWSVFTAVPFVAAITTPVLYGWNKQRSLVECILSSVICLLLMASVLLILPFEGILCLAMASPLAVGVGIVGGLVGYAIQASLPRNESVPRVLGCFAIIIPLLITGEFISPVTYPTYENVSQIEITAPPNMVWKYLINFPRLKEPTELIFKTGIAYPIEAKITGHGPGAIRECIFTTGKFVEPIEIWNEPKLLRFGVLEQAPPMHELSLYPKLHPPHLDHYLVARQGQFRLTPTENNHTILYGSTWYQNQMGPGSYWRLWSDWIIHSIHMRVLNHVKDLAETEYGLSKPAQ